ncbi:MAG TPA: ABC transporter substrate-binding protein [Gemmatimonadales bacterium]|nr:ABC transporter substrate-binding protein [Gemmatimonadales bacterium]
MSDQPQMSRLRLAQAHRPVFYLPHLVAAAIGAFARRSLEVEVVAMATSDQWQMLTSGTADIAIGGPMRAMKLAEAGARVVTFCGAVAGSPWVVIGPSPSRVTDVRDVMGTEVLDDAEIATARLCLRGLLALRGDTPQSLVLTELPTGELMRRLSAAKFELALVPLEKIVDLVGREEVYVLASVGTWTGPVPWSAYQTLPETLVTRRPELTAFVGAIGEALEAIHGEAVSELARWVGNELPAVSPYLLEASIAGYRRMGVWAATPQIPSGDFDRFARILLASGWLTRVPDRAALLVQAT